MKTYTINDISIDMATKVATVAIEEITEGIVENKPNLRHLYVLLDSINENNISDLTALANSVSWEGTIAGQDYFIGEPGVLYARPPAPASYFTWDYTTNTWVDTRTPETEWQVVREKRDKLLAASDWTQLPDVPLATKEAWAVYRQALRDITLQADPFNIVWPSTPA